MKDTFVTHKQLCLNFRDAYIWEGNATGFSSGDMFDWPPAAAFEVFDGRCQTDKPAGTHFNISRQVASNQISDTRDGVRIQEKSIQGSRNGTKNLCFYRAILRDAQNEQFFNYKTVSLAG